MKRFRLDAQDEFIAFIENYSIGGVNQHSAQIKHVYKRLHALLVLCHMVERHVKWSGAKQENFRLYYREFISDMLQSVLLAAQGLYKAAYFSSRSAIENFFRCVGIAQDQSVLSLTSTYELINAVKDTPFIANGGHQKTHFHILHGEYISQCGFVHTASAAHMSLSTIVGAYPRFVSADASKYFFSFFKVLSSTLCISALMLSAFMSKLHHSHRDQILDALPKSVKQQINLQTT